MVRKSLDEIEELAKNFNKEEIARSLQATKPSDWITVNDMTLLHVAVYFSNLNLLEYLIQSAYYQDVNVKSSCGDTALLIAVQTDNINAVKILLNADADLRVVNRVTGITALEIFMDKSRRKLKIIVPHVISNLKRLNLDNEILVDLLVASNCRLDYVFALKNAQVSRMFLERKSRSNYSDDVPFVMEQNDFEDIELMMRYGNVSARCRFYEYLTFYRTTMQTGIGLWKDFIERLFDWNVDIREAINEFDYMLQYKNLEHVQMLLDSKIIVQLRDKYDIDLRVCVFANNTIDANEFLQANKDFHINAVGHRKMTALHYAAKGGIAKNIKLLLQLDAQVDAKDEVGRTALFKCSDVESAQILFEYDANVQVTNNNGQTLFHVSPWNLSSLQLFIAQLAISYELGLPIKQVIEEFIDSDKIYKNMLDFYCKQLKILKTIEIRNLSDDFKVITLFNVLTDKIEILSRFLRDQDVTPLIQRIDEQYKLQSFYYSTLERKLKKAKNFYTFKCGMADFISQSTGYFFQSDGLIISLISSYLTERDIERFFKYFIKVQ